MASRAAEWKLGEFFEYRGDRVAYDAVGEGPPIVLVHGTPFSSYVWRRIAPALAENYRVHVFDLLGYGASDKREGQDVSLYAQGKLLARLLEHWKLESPMIVGHDFGGAITLRAHLLEGCDFERIVLMDAVSVAPWGSPFYRLVQDYPGVFGQIPGYMHRAMMAAYVRDATYRLMTDEETLPYIRALAWPRGTGRPLPPDSTERPALHRRSRAALWRNRAPRARPVGRGGPLAASGDRGEATLLDSGFTTQDDPQVCPPSSRRRYRRGPGPPHRVFLS